MAVSTARPSAPDWLENATLPGSGQTFEQAPFMRTLIGRRMRRQNSGEKYLLAGASSNRSPRARE